MDWAGDIGRNDHITRSETGVIPTASIAQLHGVRDEAPGEHRNHQGTKWEEFKRDIAQNGITHPIFITVDWDQPPKISEGNERRDAAVENGMSHVPVEIRYFGKAETQGTVLERARRRTTAYYHVSPHEFGEGDQVETGQGPEFPENPDLPLGQREHNYFFSDEQAARAWQQERARHELDEYGRLHARDWHLYEVTPPERHEPDPEDPGGAVSWRSKEPLRVARKLNALAAPAAPPDLDAGICAWYHGTYADLEPGDYIEPGHEPNYEASDPAKVYVTDDLVEARTWGQQGAENAGLVYDREPDVYEVQQTGSVHRDTKAQQDDPGAHWSHHPMRVVRKVSAAGRIERWPMDQVGGLAAANQQGMTVREWADRWLRNPRGRGPARARVWQGLARHIGRYGVQDPVVLDDLDNPAEMIEGNHRYAAAMLHGHQDIAVTDEASWQRTPERPARWWETQAGLTCDCGERHTHRGGGHTITIEDPERSAERSQPAYNPREQRSRWDPDSSNYAWCHSCQARHRDPRAYVDHEDRMRPQPHNEVPWDFQGERTPTGETFFHGTFVKLRHGDVIEPGHPGNYGEGCDDHVYFTSHRGIGSRWAYDAINAREEALGEDVSHLRPHVYEIEPAGGFHLDETNEDNYDAYQDYKSPYPLRVVREIPYDYEPVGAILADQQQAANGDDEWVTLYHGTDATSARTIDTEGLEINYLGVVYGSEDEGRAEKRARERALDVGDAPMMVQFRARHRNLTKPWSQRHDWAHHGDIPVRHIQSIYEVPVEEDEDDSHHEAAQGRAWYHGTRHEFAPGEQAEPGHPPNWDISRPGHVYLTSDLADATFYAEEAKGGGATRVYRVTPTGPVEPDLDRDQGSPADYRTRQPLHIDYELDPYEAWGEGRDQPRRRQASAPPAALDFPVPVPAALSCGPIDTPAAARPGAVPVPRRSR
jgi:rifampin ADP-ribosylating transferase